MKKKKRKLFAPPIPLKGTPEEDARQRDADFSKWLSLDGVCELMGRRYALLAERGWTVAERPGYECGEWRHRSGVWLDSAEAAEFDPIAHTADKQVNAAIELSLRIEKATPDELRTVRLAWELGNLSTLFHVYRDGANRGRKKLHEQRMAGIADTIEHLRAHFPQKKHSAKDVYEAYHKRGHPPMPLKKLQDSLPKVRSRMK